MIFININLFKKLEKESKNSNLVKNLTEELSEFLDNSNSKYSKYWSSQQFLEYNVSANIGISRWSADEVYKEEINEKINETILELSEKYGTLYRKKYTANGSTENQTYSAYKFEDNEIEKITITANDIPEEYNNLDIIFQYDENGNFVIRDDIKEEIISLASEKCEYLKTKETEKALDYKQEGHIYKAVENDGYVFLKDLTEDRGFIIEDIDFVVENYDGDGTYQVINGEYKKIS